ncbi:MAG: polysaccharide export protein, partial [bacterium]|nr:polysaccharide export protein [bacterium]
MLFLLSACANDYTIVNQKSGLLQKLHAPHTYTIGCGDRIRISVWGHDELSTDATVRPDGKISLPLLGDISVEEETADSLTISLNKHYGEYIHEPSVTVAIVEIRSLKIYVIGEVKRPGEFDLAAYDDVLQALAAA